MSLVPGARRTLSSACCGAAHARLRQAGPHTGPSALPRAPAVAAARGGGTALKPWLAGVYETRARAYRDAVQQFVEGYKQARCCLCDVCWVGAVNKRLRASGRHPPALGVSLPVADCAVPCSPRPLCCLQGFQQSLAPEVPGELQAEMAAAAQAEGGQPPAGAAAASAGAAAAPGAPAAAAAQAAHVVAQLEAAAAAAEAQMQTTPAEPSPQAAGTSAAAGAAPVAGAAAAAPAAEQPKKRRGRPASGASGKRAVAAATATAASSGPAKRAAAKAAVTSSAKPA